jgi:hypothetical protein
MLLKKMSLLLFASLVMVSCSSDDDVDPSGPVITGLDFTITATGSGNIVEVLPSAVNASSYSVDFGSDATDDVLTTVGPKVSYEYAATSASYDITVTASAAGSDNVMKTTTYAVEVEVSDIVGKWVLLHDQNALIVAESVAVIAEGGKWWSNNFGHLIERACVFDDVYEFKADMSFNNILGDETWLEGGWADTDEGCGAAYAPFDGTATATWSHNTADNTVTINGMGAFLGIATIQTGKAIVDPANAAESITYSGVTFSEDKNTMTLHIDYGEGVWQFKFAREGSVGASNPTTDADGDGVLDLDDACPNVAGDGADGCPVVATPASAAAAPSAAAADVSSIYSDTYEDVANAVYNPGWGQKTQFEEIDIDGNMILGYSQLDYQGNTFDGIDLEGKSTFHIDVYSSEIDVLKIFLINTKATSGDVFEISVSKALTSGEWTSLEIPLSEFEGFLASGGNLDQIKYELGTDATAEGNISFFIDNIYVD